MSYLDTIGWCEECAQERKEYIDSIEQCNCHRVDADAYLGWFENVGACEKVHPIPSVGMSFVNIETRSLWLYDGVAWCNTTQGNPMTMITYPGNIGVVKRGYARSFYYIPTQENVEDVEVEFIARVEGEEQEDKEMVYAYVNSVSDIVFLEWTGSTFNVAVRRVDPNVAMVKDGEVVDSNNKVIVAKNVVYCNEAGNLVDKDGKGYRLTAVDDLRAMVQSVGQRAVVSVSYAEAQSLTDAQKEQARKNIAAAAEQALIEVEKSVDNIRDVLSHFQSDTQKGLSWLSANTLQSVEQSLTNAQKEQARKNIGAVTEKNGKLYDAYNQQFSPYTDALNVYCGSLGNLDSALNSIITNLNSVKVDVNTFLQDANLSESAKDTLKEIQEYIDSDVQAAAQMLANINELRTALNTKVSTNGGDVSNTVVKVDGEDRKLGELLIEFAEGVSSLYEDFGNIAAAIEHKIEAEATRAKQTETYLETQKADKTGYYQSMSVGVADNLTGRDEAIEREFIFDQSGGVNNNILEEDTARIESIQGNTLLYNQPIINPLMQDGTNGWTASYFSSGNVLISYDSNEKAIRYEWVNTRAYYYVENTSVQKSIDGHKYYYRVHYKLSGIEGDVLSKIAGGWASPIFQNQENYTVIRGIIDGVGGDKIIQLFGNAPIGAVAYFKEISVYDLTKMFDAGNEPTTAEEAERIINQLNVPDGHNAGQLINNNTTAIKTVGLNIVNTSGEILVAPRSSPSDPKTWAEVGKIYTGIGSGGHTATNNTNPEGHGYSYAVRNDDGSFTVTNDDGNYGLGFFCKVLPNTAYTSRNTYTSPKFPRASFYDKNKVYLSNVNIIGNTFTTPYNCEYIFLVLFTINGNVISTNTFENPVIHLKNTGYMDGKYTPYPAYREETKQLPPIVGGLRSVGDVCDELRYNHNTKRWEHIKRIEERVYKAGDENNADVLTDGKDTTYYKLNEAVIEELDTDISPDYKVWDWGTEEAIQVEPSAPFRAKVKYGFNAVDQIRGNKINIDNLLARVAELESKIVLIQSTVINDEKMVE